MLSDPNVVQITPKIGNRYESAVIIAKRAREIEKRRVETGDRDITDAVDVASKEIANGDVLIKKNGKYVAKEDKKDEVIDELKDDIIDTKE